MSEINFLKFDDFDVIILWMIIQLYHFTNLKQWRAKTYKAYQSRKNIISVSTRSRSFWVQCWGRFGIWQTDQLWQGTNCIGWDVKPEPEIHQDSPVLWTDRTMWRGPQNVTGLWFSLKQKALKVITTCYKLCYECTVLTLKPQNLSLHPHVFKTPNTTIPVFKLPSPEHAIRVNPQTQELQET